MKWKPLRIVEVQVGMEVNMCARAVDRQKLQTICRGSPAN
jgi:hypothetical protein